MKRTKKLCKRCMKLTTNINGYCDACNTIWEKQKAAQDTRPSSHQRGYDWKWRMFSKEYLKKHPTCERCGAEAFVTDHKIPLQIILEVYGYPVYDEDFYQSLCTSCNIKKGFNEDKVLKEEWEEQKKRLEHYKLWGKGEENK